MPKIDRRTLSVFGLAAMLPPQFALAEDAYPSRPIHVIVGFTPGAAADITARVLGESMGLSWQQGPLSAGAIGRFLVPEPLPKSPRRLRAA